MTYDQNSPTALYQHEQRINKEMRDAGYEACEHCDQLYPRLVTFRSIDGTREKECCRACFEELRQDETESIVRGMDY